MNNNCGQLEDKEELTHPGKANQEFFREFKEQKMFWNPFDAFAAEVTKAKNLASLMMKKSNEVAQQKNEPFKEAMGIQHTNANKITTARKVHKQQREKWKNAAVHQQEINDMAVKDSLEDELRKLNESSQQRLRAESCEAKCVCQGSTRQRVSPPSLNKVQGNALVNAQDELKKAMDASTALYTTQCSATDKFEKAVKPYLDCLLEFQKQIKEQAQLEKGQSVKVMEIDTENITKMKEHRKSIENLLQPAKQAFERSATSDGFTLSFIVKHADVYKAIALIDDGMARMEKIEARINAKVKEKEKQKKTVAPGLPTQ
ncbi:hypothetical protein HDK77DRAFT_476656 [Phyllosticta capitalensis]